MTLTIYGVFVFGVINVTTDVKKKFQSGYGVIVACVFWGHEATEHNSLSRPFSEYSSAWQNASLGDLRPRVQISLL